MLTGLRPILLLARREVRLLLRSRGTLGAVALLLGVAWLPLILLPLRSGLLGVAAFGEMIPLLIALEGVILPLLALLAGADLLAGELEDGSLVSIVTLPISRRACFVGKCLGRSSLFVGLYLLVFASAGATVMLARGVAGWKDWTAVVGVGLVLSLACGAIGTTLGASGRGRLRAFGGALTSWIVLVFALDALLLAVVVALAPPPPSGVGEHGHGEIQAPAGEDPHARHAEPEGRAPAELSGWLMALNPVSLFRLTALVSSPELRPRLGLALPAGSPSEMVAVVTVGWLVWLTVPLLVGIRRFERADLQ
jgi:ABC-type transport system involved in multi-copper enzyme maturation permease subunit